MEKAKAMSAPFKKGVNLTNWLEHRPVEQVDENLFSKKDFENIKSMGCDVVRLPIHFERFCFAENEYKIPEKIWGILDHVVEWVTDLEMYVIFDFHNATDADSFTPVDVEKVLNPVWTQMTERYKDATEYLIFEIMNEPHGIEIPIWNEIVEEGVAFPQEELLTAETGREFFAAQSHTAVIEDETGTILGLYILHPNNVGRCSHICNASYAVSSASRGKHIGEKLVLDCIREAKRLGFLILQFNAVVESNIHARHLYERIGFRQLGTIPGGFRMKDGHYENICPYFICLDKTPSDA